MNRYLAVLFADLEGHTHQWHLLPRSRMVTLVAEYRYVAEGLAGLYGSVYREWAGDNHMFLFDSVDTAAQFGLRLIEGWRRSGAESPALADLPTFRCGWAATSASAPRSPTARGGSGARTLSPRESRARRSPTRST